MPPPRFETRWIGSVTSPGKQGLVHNDPSRWRQGVGRETPLIGAIDAKVAEQSRSVFELGRNVRIGP